MRVYKAYSFEQEFDVQTTLRLKVNGQFSYYRSYTSYGGGYVLEVHGKWRHDGDRIVLLPESVGKFINPLDWVEGQEQSFVEVNGCLGRVGGEDLYLMDADDSPESATS